MRLLSSVPVAGATLFEKNADTFVHYIERATGHIYEVQASQKQTPYRISNTTIPKIYEAFWTQNGRGIIVRYLKEGSDDIQTFYAGLKANTSTSSEQTLDDGTFLPNNISDLTVSPAQDKIFYLSRNGTQTVGIRSNPNGTSKNQPFSSSAHEWLVSWPSATNISLNTRPSAEVSGFLFFLNPSTGGLQKILSGVQGLTSLSNNNGSLVIYSESNGTGVALKLFDVKKGTATDLGVRTLPEKCVWSKKVNTTLFCAVPDSVPSGAYPDSWYQGQISFTDNLWAIDTKTGTTKIIMTPQSIAQQIMDIVQPVLSEKENYILFTNKKDLNLWLLSLSDL